MKPAMAILGRRGYDDGMVTYNRHVIYATRTSLRVALILCVGAVLLASPCRVCVAASASQPASSQPASSPAVEWGKVSNDLACRLVVQGPLAMGGAVNVKVDLRSSAADAIALPQRADGAKEPFAWLFLARKAQKDDRSAVAYYSQRMYLARDGANWPAELAAGATIQLPPADASRLGAAAYRKGTKLEGGYPAETAGPASQNVAAVLTPGTWSMRLMLYVPAASETLLVSNTVELTVLEPDAKALAADRKAVVAGLLGQFDRDEMSAMKAHDLAVKLGKDVLDDLIVAVKDRKRPYFSRLWMTTAIAEIPDERAVKALMALLADGDGSVRAVVAYYGPKQHSDSLDREIIRRSQVAADRSSQKDNAGPGVEDRFTAYALLGFLVFRDTVPPELLSAGLENSDPRARGMAVRALAGMANDFNKQRLAELAAKDKDPVVRSAAAKALEAMKKN